MKRKPFKIKTERATGPYRSFFEPLYKICIGRKQVGVVDKTSDKKYQIRFAVLRTDEDRRAKPSDPCPWKWIGFKARFETIEEAEVYLLQHQDIIQSRYSLHIFD